MSPSAPAAVATSDLPWISVDQMIEVDRIMIQDLGISLERMMENAGRGLANLTRHRLGGSIAGARVDVLAGGGGNGGGGLAAARHLTNAGAQVTAWITVPPERMSPAAAAQEAILVAMGVPVRRSAEDGLAGELIIDAILGYSGRGAPRAGAAEALRHCTDHRVISLDVPTGLDASTGELFEPHAIAEATLTLAAPKSALRDCAAVGELYLADISVPAGVWSGIDVTPVPPFVAGQLIRVDV